MGALYTDHSGFFNIGTAYVYERGPDSAWVEAANLVASDGGRQDYFGSCVAMAGDRIAVSARGDDVPGVFERSSDGAWIEVAKLTASDGPAGSNFGSALSMFGDQLLVGAPGAKNAGGVAVGAGYFFERTAGGAWVEVARVLASNGAEHDGLGCALSMFWNFQAWFRDPAAGGAGFNTSSAISITFEP